jgi:hypothetical protein
LPVEDLAGCLLPSHIEEEICSSRLQLVLLSPILLQFLARHPQCVVGRLLHPERVIAIMLGVRDAQMLGEHRRSLMTFAQWIHLEAKDHDLEFVQTVLYFSTQILQRNSANIHNNNNSNSNSNNFLLNHHRKSVKMTSSSSSNNNINNHLARSASSIGSYRRAESESSPPFQVHPKRLSEVFVSLKVFPIGLKTDLY